MKTKDENDIFYNIPNNDAQAVDESELLPIYEGMSFSGDIQPLNDFIVPNYKKRKSSDERKDNQKTDSKKKAVSIKSVLNKYKKLIAVVASLVLVIAIATTTAIIVIQNGKNEHPVSAVYTADGEHEILLANGKTYTLSNVEEIKVSDSGTMLYYSIESASKTGKFEIKAIDTGDKKSLRKEGYHVDDGVDPGWELNSDGNLMCYSKTEDGIKSCYVYNADTATTELVSKNVEEAFLPGKGDVVYFTRRINSVYSLHRKRIGEDAENVVSGIGHTLFRDSEEGFELLYTISSGKENFVDIYSIKDFEAPKNVGRDACEVFLNDYDITGNLYYFKRTNSSVDWRDFIDDPYFDKDSGMERPVEGDFMINVGIIFDRFIVDSNAYNAAKKKYEAKLRRDHIREELDRIDLGLSVGSNYTCYVYNGRTKELATGVLLDNILAFAPEGAPRLIYAKSSLQVNNKIKFDTLFDLTYQKKNGKEDIDVSRAIDYVTQTIKNSKGFANECVYTWYDSTKVLKYNVGEYDLEKTTFYIGSKDYLFALSDGELYYNKITSKEVEKRTLIDNNVKECEFKEGYLYYYKENTDGSTSLYRYSISGEKQHLADNIYDFFTIEKEYVLLLSKQQADTELMDIAIFSEGKFTEIDSDVSLNNFIVNGKSFAYVKNPGKYETYNSGDMYVYTTTDGVQKIEDDVTKVFYVNKS